MSTPILGRLFANNVAVDPGTASTLIYTQERGVVLNQPSVVCFRKADAHVDKARVEAVGELAKALIGRVPEHLEAVRPLRHGVIAHYPAAEQMIRQFVGMSHARSLFGRRIEFTVCVPSSATAVERRALREAAAAAGASRVNLIDQSLAAALGAGLPVTEAVGSMVVDIGGGTTEVGVVSLGGTVYQHAIRVGGDQFDAAIINHVRGLYNVLLGEQTAEHVKKYIGSASGSVPRESMRAVGRGVEDGLPAAHHRAVQPRHRRGAGRAAQPGGQRGEARAREKAPPELVTDIAHRGIVLTGGGALLAHLDRRLYAETGLAVRVADEPLSCAVRGAGEAMGRLAMETDH